MHSSACWFKLCHLILCWWYKTFSEVSLPTRVCERERGRGGREAERERKGRERTGKRERVKGPQWELNPIVRFLLHPATLQNCLSHVRQLLSQHTGLNHPAIPVLVYFQGSELSSEQLQMNFKHPPPPSRNSLLHCDEVRKKREILSGGRIKYISILIWLKTSRLFSISLRSCAVFHH